MILLKNDNMFLRCDGHEKLNCWFVIDICCFRLLSVAASSFLFVLYLDDDMGMIFFFQHTHCLSGWNWSLSS